MWATLPPISLRIDGLRMVNLHSAGWRQGSLLNVRLLLQSLVSERDDALPLHRRRAFKTWLGLRYDRPAVPNHLAEAAREVAKRCGSRGGRKLAEGVHDVLMQFDDAQTPPHIALYAVAADDADPEQIERWLSAAAQQIPSDVGVVSAIVVGTRSEISLELMETSYAADVSQLTWSGEEPVGAE